MQAWIRWRISWRRLRRGWATIADGFLPHNLSEVNYIYFSARVVCDFILLKISSLDSNLLLLEKEMC
jgi:hypothetical protein